MDRYDPYGIPASPLPAITRALILLETVVGVGIALFFDVGWDDQGWFRFMAPAMMALVALSSLFVVRIAISGAGATAGERRASLAETSKTLHVIAFSFGTAPATYGLVSVFMAGEWWIPIAFGAFAMLAQALFFSQVQAELAALRLKQQGATS